MTTATEDPAAVRKRLYKRGTVSTSVSALLLYFIAGALDLQDYALVAAGLHVAVFILHGLPFNSRKLYDATGFITHFVLVMVSFFTVNGDSSVFFSDQPLSRPPKHLLVAVASVMWMTRLGSFFGTRLLMRGFKKGRLELIMQCWLSFLGAWLIQALWVFVIQLPVILLLRQQPQSDAMDTIDATAAFLWLLGFVFESIADAQKTAFRSKPENQNRYITNGLWKYSRHPNYFGEILMWCCLAFLAWRGNAGLAVWLSPVLTTLLLLKLSGVPMLEKAGEEKWGNEPAYSHYMSLTSCIIPWRAAPAFKGSPKAG